MVRNIFDGVFRPLKDVREDHFGPRLQESQPELESKDIEKGDV
jgi:hypothetical protein